MGRLSKGPPKVCGRLTAQFSAIPRVVRYSMLFDFFTKACLQEGIEASSLYSIFVFQPFPYSFRLLWA
jgi:hypothetical protein